METDLSPTKDWKGRNTAEFKVVRCVSAAPAQPLGHCVC